ncbi:MAG: hypothetical protein IPK96_00750 [Flammeovirgaceae bacterium]|jgi:hypothetical protein|nr:hypothetical protein [Flammeovirgaceae bacterium]
MKSTFLICSLIISTSMISFGQRTQQQSIEESELGWYKVYHFKGAKEIKKSETRVYTIAQ